MARRRGAPAGRERGGRGRAVDTKSLRATADGFLSRFEDLVAEVEALRESLAAAQQENEHLRMEMTEVADLLLGAEATLAGKATPAQRRPRRGGSEEPTAPRPRRVRTTPASVTPDLVRSVIQRLGRGTAAQIAQEISREGTEVSGRAVRHIAKAAGAVARPGDEGAMVYSLG